MGNHAVRSAAGGPYFYYGYVIVFSALLMSIVMWGARISFGVFFAPVLDEFGWTRAAISGGFSLSWVLTGFLSIAVGRLNDRFGPRVIMTVSGILVGLGYLLMSLLASMWHLYLFYGIVSIGMSAVIVPTLSTVAKWFAGMRAFMTGIVLAGTSIALMVVLPAAHRVISIHGWRTAYVILGTIVIVIVVTAAQFLRRDPDPVAKLAHAARMKSKNASGAPGSGLSFKQGLRTRQLWLISSLYFCTYFVFYTLLVHMVIHLTERGISSERAIGVMGFLGGAGIAGRILMGIFADRVGNKPALLLSSALMGASLFWLLLANEFWMLVLFGMVFGFGQGGIAIMESPMVASIFGMRAHGMLLGLVFFCDTIGGAAGPVLAGYIFDVAHSYEPAFLLSALLSVIGLVSVLCLRPLAGAEKIAT